MDATTIGAASEPIGLDNIRLGQEIDPDPGQPPDAFPEP